MRDKEREFIEKSIGMDTTICSRCYATLRNYDQACTARLDDKCAGFVSIERMRVKYDASYYDLRSEGMRR